LPHASQGAPFHVGRFHILLPISGHFHWGEGRRVHVAGSQHALYVAAGREYRVTHLSTSEHSLLLLPSHEMLDELSWSGGFSPDLAEVRLRDPDALLLTYRLLWSLCQPESQLAVDELLCSLIDSMAPARRSGSHVAAGSANVIRAAKEMVHDQIGTPLTLSEIAAAAGASPVYLTNLFKRVEGVALHQYGMRLRLTEALRRLPDAADLTGLAYDLGFSSHSHFTAAFRSRFHATPRAMREFARARPTRGPLFTKPMCRARGGTISDEEAIDVLS
jgi:AraC-like DNA-binding protein